MSRKTCAKLRLFALLILGAELLALLLLLLGGPLASAFAANEFSGTFKKISGSGTAFRRIPELHGTGISSRGNSYEYQMYFHHCLQHPYACEIAYGSISDGYAWLPSELTPNRNGSQEHGFGSGGSNLPSINTNAFFTDGNSTNPGETPIADVPAGEGVPSNPDDIADTNIIPDSDSEPGSSSPGNSDLPETIFTNPEIPSGSDELVINKEFDEPGITAPPGSNNDPVSENIERDVQAVPEPATVSLVVLGLAGVAAARRRAARKPR